MIVRPLSVSEWQLKRDLRLAALKDSPKAFASTYDGEVHRSEVEWREWPRNGAFFAAFDDRRAAVGIAGAWIPEAQSEVVYLVSMWVAPQARGAGIAGRLTAAVVAWAREQEASRVELEVAAGNDAAMRAYLRSGFVPTNKEPSRRCAAVLALPLE